MPVACHNHRLLLLLLLLCLVRVRLCWQTHLFPARVILDLSKTFASIELCVCVSIGRLLNWLIVWTDYYAAASIVDSYSINFYFFYFINSLIASSNTIDATGKPISATDTFLFANDTSNATAQPEFANFDDPMWDVFNNVYWLGTILVTSTLLGCFLIHHVDLRQRLMGARMRIACCSLIYRKVRISGYLGEQLEIALSVH